MLQILLSAGADPNILDNAFNTPLTIACSSNGHDCIDLLIAFGCDLNIPSFKGNYPIHKALYRANMECFEALMKYGNFLSFLSVLDPDTSV